MSNAMSRFCCAEYATFKFGKWGSLDLFGFGHRDETKERFHYGSQWVVAGTGGS